MAERYQQRGALAALHLDAQARGDAGDAAVVMSERPARDHLALRGDAKSAAFREAVAGVLGVEPPVESMRSVSARGVTLLWLGPDEWLATLPAGRGARALSSLEGALADEHASVVDVSDSRVVIGLDGPHARDVLAKGCPLDLHPRSFGAGRCAQSLLARCHLLLHQVDDSPAYDLYIHRSFGEYAWAWLADAAAEYGLRVEGS